MSDREPKLIENINKNKEVMDNKIIEEQKNDNFILKENPIQENNINLKADNKIEPIQNNNQIQNKVYTKAAFAKNVNDLNKLSRESVSKYRMDFKDQIARSVSEINGLKGVKEKYPKDIEKVLGNISAYAEIRAVAKDNRDHGNGTIAIIAHYFRSYFNILGNRKKIRQEHELMRDIPKQIDELVVKYSEDNKYAAILDKLTAIKTTLCSIDGTLEKVKNRETKEEKYARKGWVFDNDVQEINGVGRRIETTADKKSILYRLGFGMLKTRNRNDWPLFAHEPTMEDVSQGMEGNCWFLAALSSMTPKQIKDMMLDNGDGTVTVRFYKEDTNYDKIRPTYVTVDKNVKINGAWDCLWVQVLEKAYNLFLQKSNNDVFKYYERTSSGNLLLPDKRIQNDVIDYGFVANGGNSEMAYRHFLGQRGDKINIEKGEYIEPRFNNVADTLVEAMMWGDKETESLIEYDVYKDSINRFKRKNEVLRRKLIAERKYDVLDRIKELKAKIEDEIKNRNSEDKAVRIKAGRNLVSLKDELNTIETANRAVLEDIEKNNMYIITYEEDVKKLETVNETAINNKQKGYKYGAVDKKNMVAVSGMLSQIEKLHQKIKEIKPDVNEAKLKEINPMMTLVMQDFAVKGFFKQFEKKNPKIIPIKDKKIINYNEKGDREEKTEKGISNETSVDDFEKFLDACEKDIKKRGKVLKETLKTDTFKMIVKSISDVAKIDNADTLCMDTFANLMLEMIDKARAGLHRVTGIKQKIVEGKYNNKALGYYERLEGMLATKQNVTYSTRAFESKDGHGSAGEAKNAGMVGTHVYSVHDCKILDDGRRMVLLRNPWATYTVNYAEKKTGIESEAESIGENGMFWIELNHLLNYGSDITSSGVEG